MAPAERAERLHAILADYLETVEAGGPDNRKHLLARHPDLARELESFFAGQDEMTRLAEPLRPIAEPGDEGPSALVAELDDDWPLGELGDFRLIREVGRGGMGIVYVAEQVSLGRRVALKVLPCAAAMGPKHLQRFKNEARAAAGLHHEHIVPVYAVGCERGQHFIAMQFIDGTTLARLIQAVHSPSHSAGVAPAGEESPTPPVAGLATENGQRGRAFYRSAARLIAEAAEALEYAHSLGVVHRDIKPGNLLVDAAGKLWVADFGLACFGTDEGLTVSGDLLGTLRYMSPEQALAKHGLVDHRTDVYALGATLYELLTGRPAVDGADREEILRKIAFEELAAPRKQEWSIPADLETVVLKALAKEPAGRYATAKELADDLERFVEDKPIRARRASLAQRARKWARRHRTIVGATAAALVVTIVMLAVSLTIVWHDWDKTRKALANETNARAAEAAESKRAKDNLKLAYRVLDNLHAELVGKRLGRDNSSRGSERELLQKALRFYEEFAQRNAGHGLILQLEVAQADSRAGDIYCQLGSHEEAIRAYNRALALFKQLARDRSGDPVLCQQMGKAYHNRGFLLHHLAKSRDAIESVRRAIRCIEDHPEPFDDAKEHQRTLAQYRASLAEMLAQTPQRAQAEEVLDQCLGSLQTLLAEGPVRVEDVVEYVSALAVRIGLALDTGQAEKAKAAYQAGLTALAQVKGPASLEPSYRRAKSVLLAKWGTFLAIAGRQPEAEQPLREALALDEALAREFPKLPEYRAWLAGDFLNLGNVYARTKRFAEAEQAFRRSATESEQLARDFPEVTEYRHDLATTLYSLGHLMIDSRRAPEAAPHFREAIRRWPEYADAYFGLAWVLKNDPATTKRDAPEVVRLAEKAVALGCRFPQVWAILGQAYCRTERWTDAVDAIEKGRKQFKDDLDNEFLFLAMAHWHLGHKDEAIRWYKHALERGKQRLLNPALRAEVAALLMIEEPPRRKE